MNFTITLGQVPGLHSPSGHLSSRPYAFQPRARAYGVIDLIKDIWLACMCLYSERKVLPNFDDSPERKFVCFAHKKPLPEDEVSCQEQDSLHAKYDGLSGASWLTKYAQEFQKLYHDQLDSEDLEALDRIVRQREILDEMEEEDSKTFPQLLVDRVASLDDPLSSKVVHLANGGATFSIPSGSLYHYVTYEIEMRPDDNGNKEYFFVIHNRGAGNSDKRIHGTLMFRPNRNVTYWKTSVAIKVPQSALTRDFFQQLIKARCRISMKDSYDCIVKHLVSQGSIVRSEEEMRAQETFSHMIGCQRLEEAINSAMQNIDKELEIRTITLQSLLSQERAQERACKENPTDENRLILVNLTDDLSETAGELKNCFSRWKERFLQVIQQDHWQANRFDDPTVEDSIRKVEQSSSYEEYVQSLCELLQNCRYVLQLAQDNRKKDCDEAFGALVKDNKGFSSLQTWGTCVISNRTGPEKKMASKKLRQQLKSFTISQIMDEVAQAPLIDEETKSTLLYISERRQIQLGRKILVPIEH